MTVFFLVVMVFVLMFAVEQRKPGVQWPSVAGWIARALLINALQVGTVILAGVCWDAKMQHLSPSQASGLSPVTGGLLGYLVITFIFYWWHRGRHQVYFLWKWLHQVHHSAQRIELLTTFYKHPFEMLIDSVMCSAILYVLLGLSPSAAGVAMLFAGLGELFYHWNVKTPHWVGYFFQRPESHFVHHQREVHNYNYSDLPLWDMLFGTFYNPISWNAECGFDDQRETRLAEMLFGTDVNAAQPKLRAISHMSWPLG